MKKPDLLWVLALVCIYLILGLDFALHSSPTMDEPVSPALGYARLAAGIDEFRDVHPPLANMLHALPLLGMNLKVPPGPEACRDDRPYQVCVNEFAGEFLHGQVVPADLLLLRSRLVNLVAGLLLLVASIWFASYLYGRWAGLIAGVLFVTSPEMIAHGSLATNDMPFALLTLLSLILLARYVETRSLSWLLGFAAVGSAALCTKFAYAPFLLGAGLILLLHFGWGRSDEQDGKPEITPKDLAWFLARIGVATALGMGVVLLVYQADAGRLIEDLARLRQRMSLGHHAYLMGEVSRRGWVSYFPIAYVLKTPPATLLAVCIGGIALIAGIGKSTIRGALKKPAIAVLLPSAVFGLFCIASPVNIGLRYLLALQPVLFLLAARALARPERTRTAMLAAAILLAANGTSCLLVRPHYLSYFNLLAGGPSQGWRYLSDSNLDWGQDLPALADFMEREGRDRVALAYFGAGRPEAYGLDWEYVYSIWNRKPKGEEHVGYPPASLLAVSASFVTGQYVQGFEWVPEANVIGTAGYSIFIVDISNDAQAHLRLAHFYLQTGRTQAAVPHLKWARSLDPSNQEAAKLLDRLGSEAETNRDAPT